MESLYGYGLYIRHSFLLRKECLKSDLCTYSSDFLFVDYLCWSKCEIPCGLRCGTAAACLLGLWVWTLWGIVVFSCECCVLSDRDLCVRLNTHVEESCWVQFVQHMSQSQVKVLQEKNVKYITFNFSCFFSCSWCI